MGAQMRVKSRWRRAKMAKAGGIAGSVSLLLGGAAVAAEATPHEQAGANNSLGEIVVTASRRQETVASAPYNISAYSADQLQAANITSIAALSQQVPNFVLQDTGARNSASSIPIIRGLNASQASGGFDEPRYFQAPVGFYLGNTPILGNLPLMDVERIEVLRGPQGTLYGAGTLAGAIKLVPVEPKLDGLSGNLSASAATVSHSSKADYDISGAINLPMGETLALRVAAKQQYDAGFIDQYNIMQREHNDYASGAPVLADPNDVAGSRAVYFNRKDVNSTRTAAVRTTLLWKPSSDFKLDATFSFARIYGIGGPKDNSNYAGGTLPTDPQVTLPATGQYEVNSLTLEPYERKTGLGSFDASYDLGFATLSSTVSYGKTKGKNVYDGTNFLVGSFAAVYYTGNPVNPRTVIPYLNTDDERDSTQELRLVSNGKNRFDYVAGLYFQQQKRYFVFSPHLPGADVQSAAAHAGDTTPVALGGGYLALYPDTSVYIQTADQRYKESAAYGNLTWNVNDQWQVTGGARVFHESFSQHMRQANIGFLLDNLYDNGKSLTSHIFMLNTSYELAPSVKAYATWSQGFRRGGANSFQLTGILAESTTLSLYDPDKTNNYEVGIKGFAGGWYLSAAAFYVRWDKPQIDLLTPILGYNVVVNGSAATSKGFELEMSGPLGLKGLSLSAGIAYAKARLSEDFALPAGDGTGNFDPVGIAGKSGDRLPGAPDFSGSVNLNFETHMTDSSKLTFNVGTDFRSSTLNQLPNVSSQTPSTKAPGYALLHGNIEWSTGSWRAALYGTNLANKYVKYSKGVRNLTNIAALGNYGDTFSVARPREIGLRMTYQW